MTSSEQERPTLDDLFNRVFTPGDDPKPAQSDTGSDRANPEKMKKRIIDAIQVHAENNKRRT